MWVACSTIYWLSSPFSTLLESITCISHFRKVCSWWKQGLTPCRATCMVVTQRPPMNHNRLRLATKWIERTRTDMTFRPKMKRNQETQFSSRLIFRANVKSLKFQFLNNKNITVNLQTYNNPCYIWTEHIVFVPVPKFCPSLVHITYILSKKHNRFWMCEDLFYNYLTDNRVNYWSRFWNGGQLLWVVKAC